MDATAQTKDSWSQYTRLFGELRERTLAPILHPTFVIYFVVVMVLISPCNVWVELYAYLLPSQSLPPATTVISSAAAVPSPSLFALRTALLTFFPTVAAGTAMQLVWAEDRKAMRAIAMLMLTGLAVVTALITPDRVGDGKAIVFGGLATVASLWLWWIANSRQADLLDKGDPDDPIGGEDVGAPLPGDLDGFTH